MRGLTNLQGSPMTMLIIAVLVNKLGNNIQITQEDIDAVAFKHLIEEGFDGLLKLSVVESQQH